MASMMSTYQPEGIRIPAVQNHEYISTEAGLERALEKQITLEAPVILCDHNFNLHVSLGGRVKGIIPRDEVEYSVEGKSVKDIAILTRVGKPVCFKVTGFGGDEYGERVVYLSRRAAQRECVYNYLSTLAPGDIIPARVTHLENFGAFVDIGCGLISLLSIDCISVSRISHPASRLAVGDNIHVIVKSIDEKGRIYVTLRELLGTWEENANLFSEGQTVRGTVRSVESYGIFVELTPNLAGLAEFKEDTHPDETAAVYIKSIIPEKMKIKLIIIDSHDTPQHPEGLRYFIDAKSTGHIDSWRYSPASCPRVIESVFGTV